MEAKEKAVTHAQRMIETNPSGAAVEVSTLVEYIEACRHCENACNNVLSVMEA